MHPSITVKSHHDMKLASFRTTKKLSSRFICIKFDVYVTETGLNHTYITMTL